MDNNAFPIGSRWENIGEDHIIIHFADGGEKHIHKSPDGCWDIHNIDGPAIILNGTEEYWVRNRQLTKYEFDFFYPRKTVTITGIIK